MDPESGWARKPKDQLRHWSGYDSPHDYYEDYRGYISIQMIIGISQTMRRHGLSFVGAYVLLLGGGAIIELDAARAESLDVEGLREVAAKNATLPKRPSQFRRGWGAAWADIPAALTPKES